LVTVETLPSADTRDKAQPFVTRGLVASVLGNAVEFFDFISYTFFAVYIGRAFFPSDTANDSLLLSLATFWAGFLTRPIGGLVIGAFADRAGRRAAMTLTITLMALGSFMIAIIPPYSMIGPLAPVLVVAARLLQGFSVGGEYGPSTTYLLESSGKKRRGWSGSWAATSQSIASLTAGLLGFALTHSLTEAQLDLWGWRVPFAVGIVILPIGIYIRSRLDETLDLNSAHKTSLAVIGATFRDHWDNILLIMLSIMGPTTWTYVLYYMTTYSLNFLHLSPAASMIPTIVIALTGISVAMIGGVLADRFGYRFLLVAPRVAAVLLVWPGFYLITREHSLIVLLLVCASWQIVSSLAMGAFYLKIYRCFPQSVFSTGLSVAYALSVTIFGGGTQWFITKLIAWSKDPTAPAWFLMVTSTISIWALLKLRERR